MPPIIGFSGYVSVFIEHADICGFNVLNLGSFTAECLPTNQLKVDRYVDSCDCTAI